MSNSIRLRLPFIVESQAQKEVTHNEALEVIDVLLHASALSMDENVSPKAPKPGDCYIVGDSPVDSWKKHAHKLAYYTHGWSFIEPFEGLTVWVKDKCTHYVYSDGEWINCNNKKAINNKKED